MFDASSVACVEYLNASKEYFAKETDQNHLNCTRRFAIALKYTIFVSPCTGKERVRNEREDFFPLLDAFARSRSKCVNNRRREAGSEYPHFRVK